MKKIKEIKENETFKAFFKKKKLRALPNNRQYKLYKRQRNYLLGYVCSTLCVLNDL